MWRCLTLIYVLALPVAADAGAWLREEGTGFASAAARLSWPAENISGEPSQYYTLYAEYGLRPNLTMGVDLGRSVSGGSKTLAFARIPLWTPDNGHRLAAELGAGVIEGRSTLRPGILYGYGFSTGRFAGWISVDTQAEWSVVTGATDFKLDMTMGLNRPSGAKWIAQVQTGAPDGEDRFARLAPSYVTPIGKGRYLELGMTWGVAGDNSAGILLGMWQEF